MSVVVAKPEQSVEPVHELRVRFIERAHELRYEAELLTAGVDFVELADAADPFAESLSWLQHLLDAGVEPLHHLAIEEGVLVVELLEGICDAEESRPFDDRLEEVEAREETLDLATFMERRIDPDQRLGDRSRQLLDPDLEFRRLEQALHATSHDGRPKRIQSMSLSGFRAVRQREPQLCEPRRGTTGSSRDEG